MITLDELVALLEVALEDPSRLETNIVQFQKLVHSADDEELAMSTENREAVRDLAYDLEYFVSDHGSRAEDASYFDHEPARREIEDTLTRTGYPRRQIGAT